MRGDPMIEVEEFQAFMSGMQQLNPMAKTLTASALVTAWGLFPSRAKLDLDSEMLLYAAQQLTLDPDRPRDIELHVVIMRYLYPVRRSTRTERGQEVVTLLPLYERGLRHDLAHRMANPEQFHELVRTLPEHTPADALPLVAASDHCQPWQPSQRPPQQRQAHVQGIVQAVERLRAHGVDDREWTPAQLKLGRWWFEKALQGYWSMDQDGSAIAAAWVLRNPALADELIVLAREGELKPVAPDRVVAEFMGSR
jgi:hypothetical protein